MNKAKLKGTLGLARRAGRLLVGEDMVLDGLKKDAVLIVFLASDAGPNTTKRVTDKTGSHGVALSTVLTGEDLAGATGMKTLKVAGLSDRGFHTLILKALNETEQS